MMVHMYFHDSKADREQAMMLIGHERVRFDAMGDDYRQSKIVTTVLNGIKKRQSKQYVTGLMALVMVGMKIQGKSDSVELASKVVSEHCLANPSVEFSNASGREIETSMVKPRTDPANIRAVFRSLRSVAHICASHISGSEYLSSRPMLSREPEAEACSIQTAAYFQLMLQEKYHKEGWAAWDVVSSRPSCLEGTPILLPGDEAALALFFPYLEKMQEQ